MDYMGWMLSIYDEYEKRYNQINEKNKICKSNKINKLDKIKGDLKILLKRENLYISSLLVVIIFLILLLVFCYFIGIVSNIEYYVAILLAGLGLGVIPTLYKFEPSLESYEERLCILVEILEEHNLNNKEIKKLLLKQTRGTMYKIKAILISYVGALLSTGLLKCTIDLMKGNIAEVIARGSILIILLVVIFFFAYQALCSIPNNRIVRKQKFHQLLKVLSVYELREEQTVEEENILRKINIKELSTKIKDYL